MPSGKTIPRWRKYLTVEPVVFLWWYGFFMYIPIVLLYIYQRVSDMKGFPYQNVTQEGGGCGGDRLAKNSSLWELEKEVQTLAAKINVGFNLAASIPSLLVAPLWGPWTDRGGKRKPAMQIVILGSCLQAIVTLMVMYFKWPVYVLFASAAISGFSGFAPVFMLGVGSYIADTSSKDERGFRLAVVNLGGCLAGFISFLTSGLWIENLGFIPATWFILSCSILAGIWSLFFVPEIPKTTNDTTVHFFSLENFKSVVNVFRKQREAGRKNLLLLMACMGIAFLSRVGISSVKRLFQLKSPLCWRPTLVGYQSAFGLFVYGIGGVVGVKLFSRFFTEMTVARIGMVTFMLDNIVLAFSDRTWMVFFTGIIGVFNGVTGPVLVGGMSRIVEENEQGALFSADGMVKALTQLAGSALFNTVYHATLGLTFPCIVFILCAVLVIIPFVLVGFIEMPRIVKEEIEGDQHSKEKNVQRQIDETPGESMKLENKETQV